MNDKVLTLVVGWNPENPLHDKICEAAREIGWEAQTVTAVAPQDLAENRLEKYFSDYVLWRRSLDGATNYEVGRVWHWLDRRGCATMNTHVTGLNSIPIDKYYQHGVFSLSERLREYVLPMYAVSSRKELEELIEKGKIGFPMVIKDRLGSIGKRIALIRNRAELEGHDDWRNMAVEPYVEADCDWRIFVIGGAAIGVMGKSGYADRPGDFRAKSAGVKKFNEENVEKREQLVRIAEEVAAVMHLEYAGVDIIQDKHTGRYYILEVNLAAGWNNGFSEVTGADVALSMARWFEARRELRRRPVAEVVREYVEGRKGCLTAETRRRYEEILRGDYVVRSEDGMREDGCLIRDLELLYDKVVTRRGELSGEEWNYWRRVGRMILAGAERRVSWAGNFIGGESLEEGAVGTAYYLATRKALES